SLACDRPFDNSPLGPTCPPGQVMTDFEGCQPDKNHCPHGQIWSEGNEFIDAPHGCVTPPPADSYDHSPCWGNGPMLTKIDGKGCTFWINGEQIGWDKHGRTHVFSKKFSACRSRLTNNCLAANLVKQHRKQWGWNEENDDRKTIAVRSGHFV